MSEPLAPVVLRALSAADAPLPGELLSGDPPLVWTDAALWAHNPAWRADPDGHLLAPVDAERTARGRVILVAHCPHRLTDLLARRVTIADGEAVTVAVSLLRGGAEADRLAAEHGRWWVTSAGRPVLATIGGAPWRDDARAAFALLTADRAPMVERALAAAADVLADPRLLQREIATTEDLLFAAATPAPLATEYVAVRARTVSAARPDGLDEGADLDAPDGVLRDVLRRHLDGDVARRVQEAWHTLARGLRRSEQVGRPPRAPRPARRRGMPLLLGAGVGALVLSGGLLWPDEPPPPAVAGAVSPSPTRTSPASVSPPAPTPEADATDLADVGARLLDRFAACAADGCSAEVVEDPARALPSGVAGDPGATRTVTLLDEYGGVAVLRVESGDAAQIAVIVRDDAEWLVRDVYDVADQP